MPAVRVDGLITGSIKSSLENGKSKKDLALEEYLDLCESDAGVKNVMKIEHLSRADLEQIYIRLLAAGLGQWIKGHYVALSTIAYFEPLQYLVRAEKRGVSWEVILSSLIEYWDGKV